MLNLLKISESDLRAQRQEGTSLLDIATAKGVNEKDLTDALLDKTDDMHAWLTQNYPQSNASQMTQYMRDRIAKDIRATTFGTMTDLRLLGGMGACRMSGNYGGMMNGLMGANGLRGMMNGWGGVSEFCYPFG